MRLVAQFFHEGERVRSVRLEKTALDAILLGVTSMLHLLDGCGEVGRGVELAGECLRGGGATWR